MNPAITKLVTILAAVGVYTLSATLLAGTGAEQPVSMLASLLVGMVLPELGKKASAE